MLKAITRSAKLYRRTCSLRMDIIQKRTFFKWEQIGETLQSQITDWLKTIEKQDEQFKQPNAMLLPLSIENPTLINRNDPKSAEVTLYIKGFLGSHTSSSQLLQSVTNTNSNYSLSGDVSHFQAWRKSHEVLSLRNVSSETSLISQAFFSHTCGMPKHLLGNGNQVDWSIRLILVH